MKTLLKIFFSIIVISTVGFLMLPPNGETTGLSKGLMHNLVKLIIDNDLYFPQTVIPVSFKQNYVIFVNAFDV